MSQTSIQNRASVEILGERYTIRGDADPAYIAEVARLVDSRMRDLKKSFRDISRSRLAVLTAINIADELLQKESADKPQENEEMIRRTRFLINLLDEGLTADSF